MTRNAFIAITGRANAGKSSLTNLLVGEKISIVSEKPQTTRNRINGVLTKGDTQYVFMDTPGMHKPKTKLSEHMVKSIRQSVDDVDCAILMADVTKKISSIEQLESSTDGELVVFFLEKMSAAYNGVNLNKLILETRSLFASDEDRNDFMAKVALQGYVYNDYYDDFIYEIRSCNRYRVTNGFPRLTHELLPEAICKASYEILLQKIEQYKLKDQEAV